MRRSSEYCEGAWSDYGIAVTPSLHSDFFLFFFLLFFNAAVLSILKNVKSSAVLVGCGTVDVKLFVWREWFTFGMTSRPRHFFCLFVCHFHLSKLMIDVNVVSWRSPLSFDAGSIQVNICVQVLWAHYIYIFYNLNLLKYMFIFN